MSLGVRRRISLAPPSPEAARRPPGLFEGAWLVAGKDLRIELRTREIVTTCGFFAALVAILSSVAFYSGPDTTTRVAPGAIWLAEAFASVLAVGRTWQRERDDGALLG
ncbi:MAG: heme exporter protein CcmB, partial [Polyangiaceae bacterium]